MTFSVVPVWVVEDDKGNQYGVCYSNEEANRIRSALVKAAELQSFEQPQTPAPQSSVGESTETMVEALPDSPAAETIETVVGEIDPMDEEDRAKYRRAIFAGL